MLKNRVKHILKGNTILTIPNERTFLYRKLCEFSSTLRGKRILDVGAGHQQYRHLFDAHNKYEASDLEDGFHRERKPDFYASAYDIPRENKSYDVVLMLQVLEHLEFPLEALKEVQRVLKDDGCVFISVPQAAGDHFEPHHYYNYTQYGLQSILRQAGFGIMESSRLGGMFTYVGNRLDKLGVLTYKQYSWRKGFLQKLIALPFYFICYAAGYVISLFNFIDKKQHYCIGHIVIAKKDS